MPESENKTVLIFVKDRYLRNFLADFFSLDRYEAVLANNARETMDFLQKEKYDLLIMDLDMHDLDEIELIRGIRDKDISLPIIGTSSENKAAELRKVGANYFLQKPFGLDRLRSKLRLIFK